MSNGTRLQIKQVLDISWEEGIMKERDRAQNFLEPIRKLV
jgi:hypothetical protein